MKLFIKMLLISVAACGICLTHGCIQAEPTLILKKDGSGSFDLEYSISEQSITQFKAMIKLRDQLAAASKDAASTSDPMTMLFYDPSEKGFTDLLGKYSKQGVDIEKLSIKSRNAARQVHIRLRFESLAKLVQTDIFNSYRISLQKNKNGDYILKRDGIKKANSSERISDEERQVLTPLLRGFNVTARVNTPGMILRSNATKTSRFTAQWDFNFDRNPNAITDMHRNLLEVTFSGNTISL